MGQFCAPCLRNGKECFFGSGMGKRPRQTSLREPADTTRPPKRRRDDMTVESEAAAAAIVISETNSASSTPAVEEDHPQTEGPATSIPQLSSSGGQGQALRSTTHQPPSRCPECSNEQKRAAPRELPLQPLLDMELGQDTLSDEIIRHKLNHHSNLVLLYSSFEKNDGQTQYLSQVPCIRKEHPSLQSNLLIRQSRCARRL